MIEKYKREFEFEIRNEQEVSIAKFCCDICGERRQESLINTIQDTITKCLDFEYSYVLNFEDEKLFLPNRMVNDKGETYINGLVELPSTLGLTGKAIATKKTVLSSYGKNDKTYNEKIDNLFKLKEIKNIMILPLLVDEDKGKIIGNKTEKKEMVGILQLINYLPGNLRTVNKVIKINI